MVTACGGETGEEENVESDMEGQLKEVRVKRGLCGLNWGVIRLWTSTLSVKSEEKRHFGAELYKEAWKMPVVWVSSRTEREREELKAKLRFLCQVCQEVSQTTKAKDTWPPANQAVLPTMTKISGGHT